MTRRFLLAHGLPVALAAWASTALAIVLVRRIDVAVDALVGGTPRTVPAAAVLCSILAATLPGTVRPRMSVWEQFSTRTRLRLGKAVMAGVVLLAPSALAWLSHAMVTPSVPVCLAATTMILTTRGLASAAAPLALIGYLGCVVLAQHCPSAAHALSTLAASITPVLAFVAIAAYAASANSAQAASSSSAA